MPSGSGKNPLEALIENPELMKTIPDLPLLVVDLREAQRLVRQGFRQKRSCSNRLRIG